MQRAIAGVSFFVLLFVGFFLLTRVSPLELLDPRGPVALAERNLILAAFSLMLVVVIPVFGFLFYFAWRYRDTAGNNAPYLPDWEHNRLEEFVWWAVPCTIIAVLAVITWVSSHELDPYRPLPGGAPLVVDVVALDWKWLFIYPDQKIATVNELEIPEQRPVELRLTADAPMNSLWIPELSGQIMCMPGMVTELHLLASGTGAYSGLSGNFSGGGFAGMRFEVRSVPPAQFDAWVQSVRAASSTLSRERYAALAEPSQFDAPASFSAVDNGLFEYIVDKYQ